MKKNESSPLYISIDKDILSESERKDPTGIRGNVVLDRVSSLGGYLYTAMKTPGKTVWHGYLRGRPGEADNEETLQSEKDPWFFPLLKFHVKNVSCLIEMKAIVCIWEAGYQFRRQVKY